MNQVHGPDMAATPRLSPLRDVMRQTNSSVSISMGHQPEFQSQAKAAFVPHAPHQAPPSVARCAASACVHRLACAKVGARIPQKDEAESPGAILLGGPTCWPGTCCALPPERVLKPWARAGRRGGGVCPVCTFQNRAISPVPATAPDTEPRGDLQAQHRVRDGQARCARGRVQSHPVHAHRALTRHLQLRAT